MIDGTYRLKFGKFKGEKLEDVDSDYLEWMIDNLEPERYNNDAIIAECKNQLKLRDGEGVSRTEEPHRSVEGGKPTFHFKGKKS